MAGQKAHDFITRTRAQSEDFVRAELTAVQRFENSLQRQYDGQLRFGGVLRGNTIRGNRPERF